MSGKTIDMSGLTADELSSLRRAFSRRYSTSLLELYDMPLIWFLMEVKGASDDAEEERRWQSQKRRF